MVPGDPVGALIQVHPGVARLPGTATTTRQSIHAAVLAAGGKALASHRSAALLWDLVDDVDLVGSQVVAIGPDPPELHRWRSVSEDHSVVDTDHGDRRSPVDLILPGRQRRIALCGVTVHRPRDHERLIPQRRDSIRCTNVVRTLVDLGAVDEANVSRAVGRALSAGTVSLGSLETVLDDHARKGRSGVAAFRAAIDERSIDRRPADSVLEVAFAKLVRRHSFPTVAFHQRICGWEVDFRFSGTAIVVECDGWASHGADREQFERDRRKDDDLRGAGWVPLRFTYRAIVSDPSGTARRIERTLQRWSHVPAPDEI